MISQKLEIIRRFERGKSQKEVVVSYNIESWSQWYKGMKEPITIIYGIKWNVKDICKQQTLTEPKLDQLGKLLYKTFIAVVLK